MHTLYPIMCACYCTAGSTIALLVVHGQGNYLVLQQFPGDFPPLLSPWLPVMHSSLFTWWCSDLALFGVTSCTDLQTGLSNQSVFLCGQSETGFLGPLQ